MKLEINLNDNASAAIAVSAMLITFFGFLAVLAIYLH